MIHNCGNGVYFDDQIAAMKPDAISFLHVPDDCLDMAECKRKYGQKTTLIGCIPPTWLPQATAAEVATVCQNQIDIFGANGGYILATGCEYPANLSLEHGKKMVQVAKEQG